MEQNAPTTKHLYNSERYTDGRRKPIYMPDQGAAIYSHICN